MICDLIEWNYEEETNWNPGIVLSRAEKGHGVRYAIGLIL